MLRENIGFGGQLTRIGSKAIEENVVLAFNIRHVEVGDIQAFLESYEKRCKQENIQRLFAYPVMWKSIAIEASYKFEVEFDELKFEATLKGIKVKREYKKDMETFTYDLVFEKEMEKDADLFLSTYLNQKEENDKGKKVFIEYSIHLTPLCQVFDEITEADKEPVSANDQ